MIRFESIRAVNFALFTDVTVPLSLDAQRPLTLLRGENESGKTTLMRAFVWALFGNESLPRVPEARHPVRPVWAKPGERVRTLVEVKFRAETDRGATFFKLSRSLETTDDGSVVASDVETVTLLRRDGDDWTDQRDQLQTLMNQFFRRDMRDFYFIDADKAVEFVGGPEGRHSDQLMREATTQSIQALLGLEIMRKTKERIDDRQLNWSRAAGSHSASIEQQQLARELEEAQKKLEEFKQQLSDLMVEEKDHEDAYTRVAHQFEEQISRLDEISETNARYDAVSLELAAARSRQNELVNQLGQRVDDERLFAALILPVIDSVMGKLQPLKDEGYIPPTELTLLPRLVKRDKCVCGIQLSEHPERLRHIEGQIRHAEEIRDQSHFLDSALEAARGFGNRAIGRSGGDWREDTEATAKQLSELDPQISRLTQERDALSEAREKAGSGAAIRELQKHRDELKAQLESVRERRKQAAGEVEGLQRTTRSLSERIRAAATTEKRTQRDRMCAEVADDLGKILARAYDSIERDQVGDVSRTMNTIFRNVITATAESLFGEVGIRVVVGERASKQYELYSLEGGREKPLALANGASRRAIGISFVLALAQETRTKVPLVADSLLHALSGTVKRKIVEYLTTGEGVGQPVLFGTRSDFLDREVSELLKSRAGKNYTLTSQAHAGGDVVRAAPTAKHTKQVVVCDCSVDEFCPVCERSGDQARVEDDRLRARASGQVLA